MLTDRRKFLNHLSLLALGLPATVNSFATTVRQRSFQRISDTEGFSVYIFSKVLQWVSLDKLPSTVKEMGFDGIDITLRSGGHVEPQSVKVQLPEVIKICNSEGLNIPILTTEISDAEEPYTRDILETAAKAGVKHYRLGWYKYDMTKPIGDQAKWFTDKLKRIAGLNTEYTITGHYQNHSGPYFGASIWDINNALVQIDSPALAVQYDIRHAMVEGAQSWLQSFKLIADRISSLVVKDFSWASVKSVEPVNVPLGDGAVDFPSFFNLLNKMNMTAPISIHVEHPLGGAEKGSKQPQLPKEKITEAIQNDRVLLASVLAQQKMHKE